MSTTGSRYRIDFVVREVDGDGSPLPDERAIRFGDAVDASDIADFFNRCRDAVTALFGMNLDCVLTLEGCACDPKINLIKFLRTRLPDCTLRGAMEIVELKGGPGVAFARSQNLADLQRFARQLTDDFRCTVNLRPWTPRDGAPWVLSRDGRS